MGVADGREFMPLDIEAVLVFKSNFFGRCLPLPIEGEVGGSFLTTIFGFPEFLLLRGVSTRMPLTSQKKNSRCW
jgi:hypothetical protein